MTETQECQDDQAGRDTLDGVVSPVDLVTLVLQVPSEKEEPLMLFPVEKVLLAELATVDPAEMVNG